MVQGVDKGSGRRARIKADPKIGTAGGCRARIKADSTVEGAGRRCARMKADPKTGPQKKYKKRGRIAPELSIMNQRQPSCQAVPQELFAIISSSDGSHSRMIRLAISSGSCWFRIPMMAISVAHWLSPELVKSSLKQLLESAPRMLSIDSKMESTLTTGMMVVIVFILWLQWLVAC
jgi:hypothetical protein